MKSYLSLIFLLTIIACAIPSKSYADTPCQPVYGGGQSCITANNIVLDKKVLNPQTHEFEDNSTVNDLKDFLDSRVTFQISVTNSSDKTISKIDVKDIMPRYYFTSSPGTFDAKTKTLSFSILGLKSKETKTFTVTGRFSNTDKASIAQGSVVCIVNQANATSDNVNFSRDTSQICIDKNHVQQPSPTVDLAVLSASTSSSLIKTTPATGPADFQLAGLAITGMLGHYLRKKSQNLTWEEKT